MPTARGPPLSAVRFPRTPPAAAPRGWSRQPLMRRAPRRWRRGGRAAGAHQVGCCGHNAHALRLIQHVQNLKRPAPVSHPAAAGRVGRAAAAQSGRTHDVADYGVERIHFGAALDHKLAQSNESDHNESVHRAHAQSEGGTARRRCGPHPSLLEPLSRRIRRSSSLWRGRRRMSVRGKAATQERGLLAERAGSAPGNARQLARVSLCVVREPADALGLEVILPPRGALGKYSPQERAVSVSAARHAALPPARRPAGRLTQLRGRAPARQRLQQTAVHRAPPPWATM